MPITIKVNGTCNSLVHKMSNGISTATIPDVCKTPTPGGPVPIPYPNIAQSITLSDGTTTVRGDRITAAIKGSKFAMSNGDNAGTLGGVKSNVFMKEATWILYSFDVKLDGKNASRFTDKMFHNAENCANMTGEAQATVTVTDDELKCGEAGSYAELKKKTAGGKLARDHIPSKRALLEKALDMLGGQVSKASFKALKSAIASRAFTIAIPTPAHIHASPTYGQSIASAKDDALNKGLQNSASRDMEKMQEHLDKGNDPGCAEAYKKACEEIANKTDKDYEDFLNGVIGDLKKRGIKL